MQGGRKLSAWNLFVKKIYKEGKSSNKNYSFKQALSDASKRKNEMGHSSAASVSTKKSRKGKSKKCKCPPQSGGTRRKRH